MHTLNMAWNKQQDQKNISKYTDIVFVWGIDFTVLVHITSVTAFVSLNPYFCSSLAGSLIGETNTMNTICSSTHSLPLC